MHSDHTTQTASHPGKWWIAAAILPGQLTIAFGMFGVVVALPNIMAAFATDVNAVQWVMTSYLLARVVPMPALGWMASVLGNRNLYLLGVLGTTVSTVLCGLAWNITSLIVFRVIQGVVGAQVMGIGMVMLYEAFPAQQRGLAMGLFILVASLGPTLGQLVGGYLVQEISWRAIFFLAVPSGIVGTLLVLTRIPPDAPSGEKTIDVPGLCTMTVFLVALLLALSQGQHAGWGSPYIISLLSIGVVFFVVFLVIELRVQHPVLHLRLYRNARFVMASVVVFLYNAGFMGANFLLALMVQLAFEFTPVQAGIILAPGAIIMGLIGFCSGRLSDYVDPSYLVLAGLVLFAVDMYSFAALSLLGGIGTITLLAVLQRGSFGMIFSASDTAVLHTLPGQDRRMGSGLHNMHRGVAMAFGVALSSLVLEKRLAFHAMTVPALGAQARIAAYQDCFLLLAIVFLIALVPAWLSRAPTPRHEAIPQPAAPRPGPGVSPPVARLVAWPWPGVTEATGVRSWWPRRTPWTHGERR